MNVNVNDNSDTATPFGTAQTRNTYILARPTGRITVTVHCQSPWFDAE